MRPPCSIRALLALFLVSNAPLDALHVRDYSSTLDNRLLNFPGAPIYPQVPATNPDFIHAPANLFLGIGWPAHPTDWTRQMALVSPRHFVYATHYPLGADWDIAFLGTDGQQHLYPIESQIPVINSLGQTTDLMLCTLASEVDAATGIKPFPVLNLASESAYSGRQAVVFGSFVRAGTTSIGGFTTLVNDPGFDTTRFAWFDFNHDAGLPRECDYQGGDSGAPAFMMEGGMPALIGTASGRDPQGWGGLPANVSRNYLSFIPAYLPQLDSMMESKGFHMTRAIPQATTLQVQHHTGPTLRRLMPGNVPLSITNAGIVEAHNVQLTLQSAHPPSGIAGSMIHEALAGNTWRCRRGGLGAALQSPLTLQWNSLPDVPEIQVHASLRWDGATEVPVTFTLALVESYASWSSSLANPAPCEDPDHDGLSNLIEYAVGGDPAAASGLSSAGNRLAPSCTRVGNTLHITHRRRSDASARGIFYQFESSPSAAGGSWIQEPRAGSTVTTSALSPAEAGFESITLSVPLDSERRFFRVRVELDE